MNYRNLTQFLMLLIISITISVLPSGCDENDDEYDITFEYDFRESDQSWEPFFTGFNAGWEERMEQEADYLTLPETLQTDDRAYYISAVNLSDNVKMLFRKQVGNLEPNTTYRVGYTVRFATSVPSGCAGIGGAPGEAVKVIVNAGTIKPEPVFDEQNNDYYVLNVQYLDDPGDWYQKAIIGDISNSRECEEGYEYEIKELTSAQYHNTVTTDENGNVWLLFGTRSGFEGKTELYYTYFRAGFKK